MCTHSCQQWRRSCQRTLLSNRANLHHNDLESGSVQATSATGHFSDRTCGHALFGHFSDGTCAYGAYGIRFSNFSDGTCGYALFRHFGDGTCGYALYGHFSDGVSESLASLCMCALLHGLLSLVITRVARMQGTTWPKTGHCTHCLLLGKRLPFEYSSRWLLFVSPRTGLRGTLVL